MATLPVMSVIGRVVVKNEPLLSRRGSRVSSFNFTFEPSALTAYTSSWLPLSEPKRAALKATEVGVNVTPFSTSSVKRTVGREVSPFFTSGVKRMKVVPLMALVPAKAQPEATSIVPEESTPSVEMVAVSIAAVVQA